jgi:iron complex outermembrane receptor protein
MSASLFSLLSTIVLAQEPAATPSTGSITGVVELAENGDPVHGAVVIIVGLGKFATTDEHGRFEIVDVPANRWDMLAQREHLTAARKTIEVFAGEATDVTFTLELSPIHEDITVTASPAGDSTALDVFNVVTSLDSFELVENIAGTIGEVLEEQPGVANRSFGPGPSRPIIRGFDGDRVLVMQDGIRTGDLSSQSGDHGVSIDPASLERLEVVKGPATLLYGANAIGGVVNAITPQEGFSRSRPQGTRGQLIADAGTSNAQLGVNGSIQHGAGDWIVWGGGGSRRTGDYDTPDGTVLNSATRGSSGNVGIGRFGERSYWSFGYDLEDGRYGVPFAGELESGEGGGGEEAAPLVDIDQQRQVARFDGGFRNLDKSFLGAARFTFSYIDWHHDEIETEEGVDILGTSFDNETYVLRAELEQKPAASLSGKLGVWAQVRDYATIGDEAIAPPTVQDAVAAFVYEELEVAETARLQFGARLEYNGYDPESRSSEEEPFPGLEAPDAIPRSFTGVSASVGGHFDVGESSAFVVNLTRSYRAPALEELYNFGPHLGTLTFEVGNPDLARELSVGLDLSLRRQTRSFQGEINFFRYEIDDFVFAAVTDDVVEGLRLARYTQGESRFTGFDGKASIRFSEHAWLHVGAGYVSARLTETDEPLPRIPPLHARIEVEIPYGGFTVKPEVILASAQNDVYRNETETDGYAVFNLNGSYILPRRHLAHIFSVKAFNLGNELYRSHTSYIKDLAPQMGRGIKVSYSVRFF